MKRRLLSMLMALVAIMTPIGAWAAIWERSVEIKIPECGFSTFYYSYPSYEIPEGISASIITELKLDEDGMVTEIVEQPVENYIPAGCAVILRGQQGTYSFYQVEESEQPYSENLLKGTDEETTFAEEGFIYFTLDVSLKDWKYAGSNVTNGAHKASLALPVEEYPELAEMLETLENPHLQHTHGGCEICGQLTGVEAIEAAWGTSADDLTEGTLEDAIFNAGAEGSNIRYIKLLADVESVEGIYVNGGNFTLDLNGYTISSESYTLYIQNNSNVTIVDNSETKSGKVISSGEDYFAVGITNSASVTINGGTYESTSCALNVEGENSSVAINGGSYESPFRPVQIGKDCSATITGGTFTSQSNYAIYNDGTLNIAGGRFTSEQYYTLVTKGTLTIGGGEFFAGENYAVIHYTGGTINLSEFDQGITDISVRNNSNSVIVPNAETILLPQGYCFYKGEENVTELVDNESYTIGEAPTIEDDDAPTIEDAEAAWYESEEAEAPLGFGTLADAVAAAAEENSTIAYIQLKADVEYDIYVEGGNFTLDLNGHTISSEEHTLYIQNNSNVTIVDNSETKSGKVISSGEGSFAVGIYSASVTINGGTYESTLHYALNLEENSSATINGGSYVNSYMPVFIGEGCSATIMDGIFEYTSNGAIDNYGNLVVEGGTFTYKGEGEDVEFYKTIFYYSGSIDFSNYPIDAINSIDVINKSGEDIDLCDETILLPEGYCFFDAIEITPTTVLLADNTYYIDLEPEKYAVTFEANGGEGNMEGDNIYEAVDYTLPECIFTAPVGMMFKAWQVGEEEYQPYETVTIMNITTITALWTEYVPQIIIKMHDSYGDGWQNNAIVVKKNGEEIGTATIEKGAEGIVRYDYDNSADYTFYWQSGGNSEECSFEILIDDKEVFAAERDEYEGTSDCQNYVDGALIYTTEGDESLTIVDGELTEYKNYVSTTVGTLTYTRTLPNLMWNALYVPFEIPVSALTDKYDVAYVNDVHSFDTDDDGEIDDLQMEIIKITFGTLKANYPYLIRAKSVEAKVMNLELTDATLRATKKNKVTCSSVFMQFDVTGTYNTMSQEENEDILAISTDGSWKKLAKDTALKPFRLYLTLTALDGSPVKVEEEALTRMRIVIRGEEGNETGIDQITTSHDKQTTTYYDLSGRRVKTPVKGGLYIVNGKKVVY